MLFLAMYQLTVETLVSPAVALNALPGAEATATANSDIALFLLLALIQYAQAATLNVAFEMSLFLIIG